MRNDLGHWLNFEQFERSASEFRCALRDVDLPVGSLAERYPAMREIQNILGAVNLNMAALLEVRCRIQRPKGLDEQFADAPMQVVEDGDGGGRA